MDVVNEIAMTPTTWGDRPKIAVVMEQVTVDTFGETYPEPETI